MTEGLLCSVCNDEPMIAVVAVPGCPCSMAYGQKCLEANAHPWEILVAMAVMVKGRANVAPWFQTMIDDTCRHLGRTLEQFDEDVIKASVEVDNGPMGTPITLDMTVEEIVHALFQRLSEPTQSVFQIAVEVEGKKFVVNAEFRVEGPFDKWPKLLPSTGVPGQPRAQDLEQDIFDLPPVDPAQHGGL